MKLKKFDNFLNDIVFENKTDKKESLISNLEECIKYAEEVIRLFEKDDNALIESTLPILDLCQTNLNFQDKKSEGFNELFECSKEIINKHVSILKDKYSNNDPVMNLITSCEKL